MWVTGVDHRVGSQACASWRERIVGVSLSPQVPKTADVLVSDSSYHHRQNTGLVLCLWCDRPLDRHRQHQPYPYPTVTSRAASVE